MDHLPLPPNAAVERMRVPLVCGYSYDGDDFMTYPIRATWPQVLPSPGRPVFAKSELDHPSNDRELEIFFQRWIFFGLLCELLGEEYLYNELEYIEAIHGDNYIHTKNLVARLHRWEQSVQVWDLSRKSVRYHRLLECLELAEDSLKVPSQEPKTAVLVPDRKHAGFSRAIKLSLVALCETIACTVNIALLGKLDDCQSLSNWMQISWNGETERAMKRNFWCPSEIGYIWRSSKTVAAQTYICGMSRPRQRSQHSDCTGDVCEELQVKPDAYKTKHCCESQQCEFSGPDMEDVYQILEKGSIPV